MDPLVVRWDAATAYQAEKYRRHPSDDPLYVLAHTTPLRRLKQQTWQQASDDILCRVGINPSQAHWSREHENRTASVAAASSLQAAVDEAFQNLQLRTKAVVEGESTERAALESAQAYVPDLQEPPSQTDQPSSTQNDQLHDQPAQSMTLDITSLYHFELMNERFVPVLTSSTNEVIEPDLPLHFVMDGNHTFIHPPPQQAMHYVNAGDSFVPIDSTTIEPPISLQRRQPLEFISRVAPWQTFNNNIKIVSDIPSTDRFKTTGKRVLAESAIDKLGDFDLSLYTDGSVENRRGASACISYNPHPSINPYKKRRMEYSVPICITKPSGRLCNPSDAEFVGIDSALDYILDHRSELIDKRVFIGTDAQSILKALDKGPHRRYRYLGVNTSPLWEKLYWIMEFVKELYIHYVPGHVGIVGNELADDRAKRALATFTTAEQDQMCASLSNLKSYLHDNLLDEWNTTMVQQQRCLSLRYSLLHNTPSDLKARKASPRPQQSLHSQYRCDRVVSAGVYPRKLKYINNPSCRFCGYPRETISHLLDDCAGTRTYCSQHDLSTQTLVKESPSSLLKVAKFDDWIRKTVHYDSKPPGNRIRQSLGSMNTQPPPKRRKDKKQNIRSKRNCLVIPDDTLVAVRPTKIRRLKT
jgi:ribonuclease HI